jgi:hypothetical protein
MRLIASVNGLIPQYKAMHLMEKTTRGTYYSLDSRYRKLESSISI